MKTGDYKIVDEWFNNVWASCAKEGIAAITKYIPDYKKTVIFRTSTRLPSISKPIKDTYQLVINYNSERDCYIVWNAAIQSHIHTGKKIQPSIGKKGEIMLHERIEPDSIIPLFRGIGYEGSKQVELILFVGKSAIDRFCKEYKYSLKPDCKQIPKGKTCLYAIAGGEIEYIRKEDNL